MAATPLYAQTAEVTSEAVSIIPTPEVKGYGFWTEFDITFWQTAPFMVFWGYVIDQQLSSLASIAGAPHWAIVVPAAILVSAGNAYYHANKVVKNQK